MEDQENEQSIAASASASNNVVMKLSDEKETERIIF